MVAAIVSILWTEEVSIIVTASCGFPCEGFAAKLSTQDTLLELLWRERERERAYNDLEHTYSMFADLFFLHYCDSSTHVLQLGNSSCSIIPICHI